MSLNVSALRESFELIAPRADQLAERFYFRLFERAPRLKPLFASTDFADQRRQLVQALIVIVRSLEQPETLQKYLRELGNRHAASGVVADDYMPFADTLLALLAEFTGEAWTAEFQSAWSDALEFIASVMSQAAPEEVVCDNETRPAHAAAASRAAVSRPNVARNGFVSRGAVAAAGPAALTAPATAGHHGRMEKAATPVSAMPPTSSNGSDEQAFDRFFGMVEHAPLAQFFVQPDGTVAYLNRKGQEVVRRLSASLEFGPQEFVGGSIEQLYRVQPALRSAAQNLRAERRLRIAVGEEWLDVSLVPVQDGEGRRLGVVQSWSVATDQIRLSDEFRSLAQLMSGSARQVRGDVDGMTDAAEQAVRRSRDAVAAGESAAKNVEAGLSATEELSVSIAEVARLVQDAVTMTRQAVQDADRTRCTIAELDESSREIGRIVKVVTSIAQQTNLLALNATIEAARAGDAGKGFAVVANEVKELARQTARAIEGIHKQAGAIQLSVDTADDALGALCASIGKINQLSTTVAGAVEEQAVATGRISRNAVQAVTKTAEATGNIADILQAAAECGKSTAEILASANTLIDASAQLDRLTIDSKRSLSYEENSPGR